MLDPDGAPPRNGQKRFDLFVSDRSIAQESTNTLTTDNGLTDAHSLD